MARRQTENKNWLSSTTNLLLVVVGFALYLTALWFAVTHAYQAQPLQKNTFAVGQTYSGENYAPSLDLRVAKHAIYPSDSIRVTDDLGTANGVHKQIVNFAVKVAGLSEYGLMYAPASPAPSGGYPVIILCHGYYNPEKYQTTSGYTADMNFYASHGFAVIKPDFRGQGLSKDQGQPASAYYSMAYNSDLMSLITAVKQTPSLNKDKINLWGHSMGAFLALRAAVLSPDIKSVILLGAPVGNPIDMYQDYVAPSDKFNPLAQQMKQAALLKYGTPVTNPIFWDHAAPIKNLQTLKAAVQIHVGSEDKVVPPLFSAELDQALTKAGDQHQYYVYQNGDHGLMSERSLIWQRSLALLNS